MKTTLPEIDCIARAEAMDAIERDVQYLTEDIAYLTTRLKRYHADYGTPSRIFEECAELAATLLMHLGEIDSEWLQGAIEKETAELWDIRNHYGCEPADYAGMEE